MNPTQKLWLYIILFALIGRELDRRVPEIYVVGTFLFHFTYNSMIRKVRRSEVGKLLEIKYS